jgi:hypothetical protein
MFTFLTSFFYLSESLVLQEELEVCEVRTGQEARAKSLACIPSIKRNLRNILSGRLT